MKMSKREIIVDAVSTKTLGIKSKDEVWYNMNKDIAENFKMDAKVILDKLGKGDLIELAADFEERKFNVIKLIKKSEKKEGGWADGIIPISDLLERAHKKGFEGMETESINVDWEKKHALTKVTIIGKDGVRFSALGDATQENCGSDKNEEGKKIRKHWIRMSETRALSRALRFYLGEGKVAKEELEHE